MAQLEDEIGKLLLLRQPSGIRMTVEGEALYREALQILRQIDGIRDVVESSHAQLSGRVTIAMAYTQALQYALPLIRKVRDLHPRLQLEIFDCTSSDALNAVASGQRDLAVVVWDHEAALLASQPVLEEELFLISRADQAPQGKHILRSDLARLPLILPSRDQMPGGFYEFELNIQTSMGATPDPHSPHGIITVNSVGVYRQAVLMGDAHAIQPWGALLDEIESGRIKATPLKPRCFRKVCVGAARGASLSQAVRAVQQALFSVIEERLADGLVRGRLLSEGREQRIG